MKCIFFDAHRFKQLSDVTVRLIPNTRRAEAGNLTIQRVRLKKPSAKAHYTACHEPTEAVKRPPKTPSIFAPKASR